MNLELATAVRTAINNTLASLRPPIAGTPLPETARTALQTHLDALLKAELQALTGQEREGVLAGKFMQQFAACIDPRKDPEPPATWYPDDSGE